MINKKLITTTQDFILKNTGVFLEPENVKQQLKLCFTVVDIECESEIEEQELALHIDFTACLQFMLNEDSKLTLIVRDYISDIYVTGDHRANHLFTAAAVLGKNHHYYMKYWLETKEPEIYEIYSIKIEPTPTE